MNKKVNIHNLVERSATGFASVSSETFRLATGLKINTDKVYVSYINLKGETVLTIAGEVLKNHVNF